MTYAQFVADFPEFSNTALFPESGYNFWANLATILFTGSNTFGATRWGALLDIGIELFVAHNLVLEAFAQGAAAGGGIPGLNKGTITAEAAGKVSVSYDSNTIVDKTATHYNATTYGTRLMRIMKVVGMGPIQVGTCGGLPGTISGGGGWPGPIF